MCAYDSQNGVGASPSLISLARCWCEVLRGRPGAGARTTQAGAGSGKTRGPRLCPKAPQAAAGRSSGAKRADRLLFEPKVPGRPALRRAALVRATNIRTIARVSPMTRQLADDDPGDLVEPVSQAGVDDDPVRPVPWEDGGRPGRLQTQHWALGDDSPDEHNAPGVAGSMPGREDRRGYSQRRRGGHQDGHADLAEAAVSSAGRCIPDCTRRRSPSWLFRAMKSPATVASEAAATGVMVPACVCRAARTGRDAPVLPQSHPEADRGWPASPAGGRRPADARLGSREQQAASRQGTGHPCQAEAEIADVTGVAGREIDHPQGHEMGRHPSGASQAGSSQGPFRVQRPFLAA